MATSLRSTLWLGFAAAPLLALSLPLAPARAQALCPDGTEAEFCFPPPAPAAPPLSVNVYRTDARLQPVAPLRVV